MQQPCSASAIQARGPPGTETTKLGWPLTEGWGTIRRRSYRPPLVRHRCRAQVNPRSIRLPTAAAQQTRMARYVSTRGRMYNAAGVRTSLPRPSNMDRPRSGRARAPGNWHDEAYVSQELERRKAALRWEYCGDVACANRSRSRGQRATEEV
jgi:hypothetical protein